MTFSPPTLEQSTTTTPTIAPPLRRTSLARRLLQWTPVLLLVLFTVAVFLAPTLAMRDPDAVNLAQRLKGPSADTFLGTDSLGRDAFTRLLHGGRRTLIVGMLAVGLSVVIATLVGATAGYLGGWVDLLVSGMLDILLSLPGLLVTLALLGALGTGEWTLIIALVGGSWAGEARIVRGAVYSVRESAFVEAVRSSGAGRRRILLRHILPNVFTPIVILASLNLGEALLVVSALSFLGLGVQPPQADWGVMLADSRQVFSQAPWLMLAPGLCIVLFSLLANLSGDTLRARLDPRAVRG